MTKNFLLLIILFTVWSCDEIPTKISDSNDFNEDRVVLVEEFSGGSCIQCADAGIILNDQVAKHGNKLVVVTIHTLTLGQTAPANGATYDFRTEKGQDLLESLGLPLGLPSGIVNRKIFEGEFDLQSRKEKWSNRISEERAIKPKVNLNLNVSFNESSRVMEVEATIIPVEDISDETRLTLLITESHLIDKQVAPAGVIEDWEHNHILRDFITEINGTLLSNELEKGVPVIEEFNFTVPPEDGWWVAENLEVVGFVSEASADSREVLQAASVHLVE